MIDYSITKIIRIKEIKADLLAHLQNKHNVLTQEQSLAFSVSILFLFSVSCDLIETEPTVQSCGSECVETSRAPTMCGALMVAW